MNKKICFIVFILITLMSGCSSSQVDRNNNSSHLVRNTFNHSRFIYIVDMDNKPIENAKFIGNIGIYDKLLYKITTISSLTITSNENGILFNRYSYDTDTKINDCFTFITGMINFDQYYPKEITINEMKMECNDFDIETKDLKIILYSPNDYYSKDFLSESEKNKAFKDKIDNFIERIKLQGYLSNYSLLKNRSINIDIFKDKKYLDMKFDNTNVYNSNKINKYDVAKTLFDEMVVKVLKFYDIILSEEELNGGSIKIMGHLKDFTNENESSKNIEYRFIFKKEDIINYRNLEITSQKLLDNSIVLMDGERIELKLQ